MSAESTTPPPASRPSSGLEDLPAPLAVVLRRMRETEEPASRLEAALRAGEFVQRYAALVAASAYLEGEEVVEDLSRALDDLVRSGADGAEFLTIVHRALPARGPVAAAVRAFYQAAELDRRMIVRDIVDGREVDREIGTLSQLASFRHDLPMNLASLPRSQVAGAAEFAGVLLESILAAAKPLLALALVQGPRPGEPAAVALRLEGAGPFRREGIRTTLPLATDEVHLIDRATGAATSLHPFLVHHECYYCLKEDAGGEVADGKRELFVLERATAARIYYRGPRHAVALREFRSALRDRLEAKRVRSGPGPVADVADRPLQVAGERTLEALRPWLDRKPYVPRHVALGHLERFLEARDVPVLVLAGESGVGKTTLVAHSASAWIARGHGVLYEAADGAERLDLAAEVDEALGGREARDEALARMEKDPGRRLVVVLDGLDRAANPFAIAETARRFVEETLSRHPSLKLILVLRDVFHEEASEEGLGGLLSLPPRAYYSTPLRSLDGVSDAPWVRLERFDPKETEALYEGLRRQGGSRPRGAFHELRRHTRGVLSHPERARLAAVGHHDRDLPHPATLDGLLDQYATRQLFRTRERRELLEGLVETLYRGRLESIPIDQLIDSADDDLGRQVVEGSPRSAWSGLLEDGVLVRSVRSTAEVDVESVGFELGSVLDWLLYRYLHRRYEDSDEVVVELARAAGRLVYPGALEHLVSRRLASTSKSKLERLLERGGPRLERILARTLLYLDELVASSGGDPANDPLRRLVDRLLETGHVAARRALDRLADGLYRLDRLEDCAHVTGRLAEAAEASGEDGGRASLRAAHAALAAGDAKASYRHLKRALKSSRKGGEPGDVPRAHALMADLEIRAQRPKKALGWIDKAIADPATQADPALAIRLHRTKAGLLEGLGSKDKAIEEIDRAIDLAGSAGDKGRQADLYLERGERTLEAGGFEQAGFFLERAVHLARQTGDPARTAAALDRLSGFHRKRGHREAALAAAQEALGIQEAVGRSVELVGLLCQVGADLEALDRRDEAAEHYARARGIAKDLGDDPGLARAHHRLGGLHYGHGAFGKALDEYAKALELWKRLGERVQVAGIYHNIGMLQQAQGDNAKALEYYKRSEAIKQELGDEPGRARTLNQIARIHAAWKEYDLAFECLDRAVDILFAQKDWPSLATSHNVRGQILFEMEKYQEALASYSKSGQILESIGDPRGLAACENNIALVHKARGDLHEALRHYKLAAEIQERIGDRRGLAATYNNIGVVHDSRGDYEPALESYEKDLAISRSIGDRRGVGTTLHNIAILHVNHRQYAKSLVALEECLGIFRDLKDREMEDRIRDRIRRVKEIM